MLFLPISQRCCFILYLWQRFIELIHFIYYLSQGGSFKEAARRNDISDGTLQRWIRIFAPSSEFETELTEKGNDMDTEEKKKLEKRIKELEKALEYSNLRADAYSKMIDVAEEVLNISIRKKSGTKQ